MVSRADAAAVSRALLHEGLGSMEFRQLKYFVTLAEDLNFSRAAERLCITQPPLTRQIQQLEEELCAQLFTRTPRKVELTAAGRSFLTDARRLLALAEQAAERTQRAERGELGRLDVGVFGSSIFNIIPQLFLRFRRRSPAVTLSLNTMTKTEQVTALRERRLSIGFNRIYPREPDMMVETVLREPLFVAAPQDHRFADLTQVAAGDLDGEPLILFPNQPRPSLADDVVAICRRAGFLPRIEQEVSDVVCAMALVSTGFGVALAPESAVNLRLPGLIYRPMASPTATIELNCMYRRDDDNPALHAFLAIVRDYPRDHQRPSPLET